LPTDPKQKVHKTLRIFHLNFALGSAKFTFVQTWAGLRESRAVPTSRRVGTLGVK